jgi:hypothetical protein
VSVQAMYRLRVASEGRLILSRRCRQGRLSREVRSLSLFNLLAGAL